MNGEWCYFKSYFDKATCKKILDLGLNVQSADAVVGVNNTSRTDYENRRSKIRFMQSNDPTFSFVFDSLWKTLLQANRDFFNIHISKLDYIQLAEYNSEYRGEYKDHHDVFWINGDPLHHRKISCIVQLTDPKEYEGGDFQLIDTSSFPNAEEIKQQGSVIFFPSFFMHRALPVTKGVRYSLAAWFDGPKWR
jgi:PKHD-type hydroxylase